MWRHTGRAAVVVFACALGTSAHAALIEGFELLDAPDIASGFIDAAYNAETDLLVANGFALSYDDGGGPVEQVLSGSFGIQAEIDELGTIIGGNLAMSGNLTGYGPNLLTGDLVAFGYVDGGGDLLQFIFTVTGGELASAFGGASGKVGVILDVNGNGYAADFLTQGFDNRFLGIPGTGTGVSDTAPVPLPAPGGLAVLALGLIGRRRRR